MDYDAKLKELQELQALRDKPSSVGTVVNIKKHKLALDRIDRMEQKYIKVCGNTAKKYAKIKKIVCATNRIVDFIILRAKYDKTIFQRRKSYYEMVILVYKLFIMINEIEHKAITKKNRI